MRLTADRICILLCFMAVFLLNGCGENSRSVSIETSPKSFAIVVSKDVIDAPSLGDIIVYPKFIPLNTKTVINASAIIRLPNLIKGSVRLIRIDGSGQEEVIAKSEGNEAGTITTTADGSVVNFQTQIVSKQEAVVYLVIEAKFLNDPASQRTTSIPIEFSSQAQPNSPSAIISDSKVEFKGTAGNVVNSIPLNSTPETTFLSASGVKMLRLTTEQALVSDDLSHVLILSRTHVTPDTNSEASEADEPEYEKGSIRVFDATGKRWEINLAGDVDLLVPSRPFSKNGNASLVTLKHNDNRTVDFLLVNDTGVNQFVKTGMQISPDDIQLSSNGRFIGWQGYLPAADGKDRPIIQVIDSLGGKVWEYQYDPNAQSVWIADVPGAGFTVFINGLPVAKCAICS